MHQKWRVFWFVFFGTLFLHKSALATISLAEWTFPNNPDDNLVDTASPENTTEILEVIGTNLITYNNSGSTTFSARATGWQGGANTKYWYTKISTVGYKDIAVSAKLRSSSTGPRDFSLQYRLADTGAWLDVIGGTFRVADNFTTGALELLPLPDSINNQESLYLRFILSSDTAVNGGSISSTGSSRIDDFIITGIPLEEDTPTSRCTGPNELVTLSEIFPYPEISDQEYAEVFNEGNQCVDLSGWRLEDGSGHRYILPTDTFIEPGGYFTLIQNLSLNNTSPDTLTLYTPNNEERGRAEYSKSLKGFSYSWNESSWEWSSMLTPDEKNLFDVSENENEEETPPEDSIYLSEIFPNPLGDESKEEFIEIENRSDKTIDIAAWQISDGGKPYIFPTQTLLLPKTRYAFYRSIYGFALNNTGTETLMLKNPAGQIADQITYNDAVEGQSYARGTSGWLWTKFVTPHKENLFSKLLKISITSKKKGYRDIPLNFSAHLGKDREKNDKYTWDFGDGRKSYLASPKHTYNKTGKYQVRVTIRRNSDTIQKTFPLTIKKFPLLPITITKLLPNPKGKDSESEWIEIENNGKKDIDLSSWKIATKTGETERYISHPFKAPIILKSNQSVRLTQKEASFSLNNTASFIELRSPDNTPQSSLRYQEKKILEGSICQNIFDNCIFEVTSSKEEKKDKKVQKEEKETPTDLVTNTPTEENRLSDKELLLRIIEDVNLLFNHMTSRLFTLPK